MTRCQFIVNFKDACRDQAVDGIYCPGHKREFARVKERIDTLLAERRCVECGVEAGRHRFHCSRVRA